MIDSQLVKVPYSQTKGRDADKKIVECERHIAVDTDCRSLMAKLTPADSVGAEEILDATSKR